MTTHTYVSNADLRSYGIKEVGVEIELYRRRHEDYHGVDRVYVDDVIMVDDDAERSADQHMADVTAAMGYNEDETGLMIYEMFERQLEDLAVERGPRLEEEARSSYMAERAERRRKEGIY